MSAFTAGSTALTPEQSRAMLRKADLGRLVVSPYGETEVYPVNYAVTTAGDIVFRTDPGSKLAAIAVAPRVTFEVDSVEPDRAWSVVARGRARVHTESGALSFADALEVHPWVGGDKYEVVEVEVDWISGRCFDRGE